MPSSAKQVQNAGNTSIIQSVQRDFNNSNIQGSEDKPLDVSKANKSRSKQKIKKKKEDKLHQILRKKEELQTELSRVKQEQLAAKQKRVPLMSQSQETKTKCFRSTITEQEKVKINQILRQTNKFEKQAAEKSKILLQKITRLEEEQKKEMEERKRDLSQKKKQQIAQKLQQIKIRKQKRTKIFNQTNREFQKVSHQKFLHEKIEEKWKIVQASQQEENEKILARKIQQKKYNADQIKAHSRRYSEIMNNYKQQRDQSTKKIRQDLAKQSRMVRYPSSTFFQIISEEDEIKKRHLMEKTQQPHMFRAKKTMYGETVREKNNKSPKKQFSPPQSKIDIRTAKSLDNLGKIKLGNDYMKQIHSNIHETPVMSYELSQINKAKVADNFKYPDYLTENRKNRKKQNPENESQDIVELKKIIKKKNQDDSTRLLRAKILARKMDQKADGSSKNLVESIAAKLSIIEEFSNCAK